MFSVIDPSFSWVVSPRMTTMSKSLHGGGRRQGVDMRLWAESTTSASKDGTRATTAAAVTTTTTTTTSATTSTAEPVYDYTVPEDAVVLIQPAAMKRLRELRRSELKDPINDTLILRMGVRSGGCSGMSYVMNIVPETDHSVAEDDVVDDYVEDKIQCVVDAKSMLYLYGLQLDYSTELIGGGFKFFNPNAEESCGCGSSFGV